MAQALFIIGCGRSGTQALARMLDNHQAVTMHHEYMVHLLQPAGCDYFMGQRSREEILQLLTATHKAGAHYAETPFWGDCSNKLAWVIEPLIALLPDCKIVHIVRDGRSVVSSLFHKLGAECLDDRSTKTLKAYYDDPAGVQRPPPEKPYWWPQARPDDAAYSTYQQYDHFQRICYHWQQINDVIETGLAPLPGAQKARFRLEDITSDPDQLDQLGAFLGLTFDAEQHALMARPHNVVRPVHYALNDRQLSQFWDIAANAMNRYGYQRESDYSVDYKSGEKRA